MIQSNKNIELVAWGTKRGQQIFFNSPGFNIKAPDIQATLKDIRPVLRFDDPEIDFYALEYTTEYRVYTLYRSVYDWSNSPGYLALTLYVPHDKHVDVLQILGQLKGLYLAHYMDSSYRISKNREDPAPFLECIKSANTSSYSPPTAWKSSTQNDEYGVLFYENENELSGFWGDPYQIEYQNFQEVLFLQKRFEGKPLESLKRIDPELVRAKYELAFNFSDKNGNPVPLNNYEKEIKINGNPVSSAQQLQELKSADSIQFVIKKQHHQVLTLAPTTIKSLLKDKDSSVRVVGSKITLHLVIKPRVCTLQLTVIDEQNAPIRDAAIGFFRNNSMTPMFASDKKGQATINEFVIIKDTIEVAKTGFNSEKIDAKSSDLTYVGEDNVAVVRVKLKVKSYTLQLKNKQGKPIITGKIEIRVGSSQFWNPITLTAEGKISNFSFNPKTTYILRIDKDGIRKEKQITATEIQAGVCTIDIKATKKIVVKNTSFTKKGAGVGVGAPTLNTTTKTHDSSPPQKGQQGKSSENEEKKSNRFIAWIKRISFFKLVVFSGFFILAVVAWVIFGDNFNSVNGSSHISENNTDNGDSLHSGEIIKIPQIKKDSTEVEKALAEKHRKDIIAQIEKAAAEKIDSIKKAEVAKKETEAEKKADEIEIKKKLKRIVAFSNAANFKVTPAEKYIKYLKKRNVKRITAKESINATNLSTKLKNMRDIGSAMYNFENYNDLSEDIKDKNSSSSYRKKVEDLYNGVSFSGDQNIFLKKWLDEH